MRIQCKIFELCYFYMFEIFENEKGKIRMKSSSQETIKTLSSIQGIKIPASTLAFWCVAALHTRADQVSEALTLAPLLRQLNYR